ncbi:hypothetical protein KFE26_19255 [Shewanella sp. M16]|uniref:DUF6980 domain-containing protein n=1 Tax=Shewanella phage vB_SspM_M16-3 TaxID=2866684 RepID=A0AAE8BN07_9CAUD|nr:hypothetical protein PQA72_gp19 [Shewanella phage vB_SspM_M16-3]MBS0044422.1 hypothetical protein [Shewanella sp. M16]QYW06309.1 hypothetical protein M163_p19 [Shewanella phage vB_SspM_M16-3]
MNHCCKEMLRAISAKCQTHEDEFACPDVLVTYSPKFDEYGLIVHDGGTSSISIYYCPWCGTKLPESKREAWFDAIEKLGIGEFDSEEIPEKFKSEAWYKNS